jgi:hypothetical protein
MGYCAVSLPPNGTGTFSRLARRTAHLTLRQTKKRPCRILDVRLHRVQPLFCVKTLGPAGSALGGVLYNASWRQDR